MKYWLSDVKTNLSIISSDIKQLSVKVYESCLESIWVDYIKAVQGSHGKYLRLQISKQLGIQYCRGC